MTYDPERYTLVAIDLSVAMHQIEESLKRQHLDKLVEVLYATRQYKTKRSAEIALLKQITLASVQWLESLDWMGELKPKEYRVVHLRDYKTMHRITRATHVMPEGCETDDHMLWGYWRHEYLKRLEVAKVLDAARNKGTRKKTKKATGVAYKDGRSHSSNNFKVIKGNAQKLLTYPSFGYAGYEADDLAGALVRANAKTHQLLLVTTDTDWLGLFTHNLVNWFCMFGYYPRLRDTPEILNEWSMRRLKAPAMTGQDIFDTKATKGDKSDNLPGGCPEIVRGVVDLCNQPYEFDPLRNQMIANMVWHMMWGEQPPKVDGRAIPEMMAELGLSLFLRPYESARDYPQEYVSLPPEDLF